MLSNIVHNSNQLIKSQYYDEESLLNQLVKLKGKKRQFSYFQSSQKRGSIFQEPQIMHKLTLDPFKSRNQTLVTCQKYRTRSKSQQNPKIQVRVKFQKHTKLHESQKLKISSTEIQNIENKSKTIHSRKNNQWFISNTNSKVHHQRVFSKKDRFSKDNQIIQEPGFVNLCFYKNSLQQIQNIRSARLANRKRSSPKRVQRDSATRNKIRFIKYKGILTDQNPQCRPWSPKNQSDINQSEFPYFKSLFIKS